MCQELVKFAPEFIIEKKENSPGYFLPPQKYSKVTILLMEAMLVGFASISGHS